MPSRFYKAYIRKLYLPDGKKKGQNNKMSEITATASELAALDGATAVNDTAGKAAIIASGGSLQVAGDLGTGKNIGTGPTGQSVQEGGTSARHTTKITLVDFDLGAVAAAADEAIGALLYTFPTTGDIIVHKASIVGSLQGQAAIAADTPDFGLGTVVAEGAVSVLSGTATFENIVTGQTLPDCDGTQFIVHTAPTAGGDLALTKGTNAIYMNAADGWAAASSDLLFSGTVWIDWYIRSY